MASAAWQGCRGLLCQRFLGIRWLAPSPGAGSSCSPEAAFLAASAFPEPAGPASACPGQRRQTKAGSLGLGPGGEGPSSATCLSPPVARVSLAVTRTWGWRGSHRAVPGLLHPSSHGEPVIQPGGGLMAGGCSPALQVSSPSHLVRGSCRAPGERCCSVPGWEDRSHPRGLEHALCPVSAGLGPGAGGGRSRLPPFHRVCLFSQNAGGCSGKRGGAGAESPCGHRAAWARSRLARSRLARSRRAQSRLPHAQHHCLCGWGLSMLPPAPGCAPTWSQQHCQRGLSTRCAALPCQERHLGPQGCELLPLCAVSGTPRRAEHGGSVCLSLFP